MLTLTRQKDAATLEHARETLEEPQFPTGGLVQSANSPNTNTPPQLINTFGLMIVIIVALKSPKLTNVNRRRSDEGRRSVGRGNSRPQSMTTGPRFFTGPADKSGE